VNALSLFPDLSLSPLLLAGVALCGVLAGYASGLLGVGGGFLLTPLLITLFNIPVPLAVGAGVTQMIAVAILSSRRHAAAGCVDFKLSGAIAPGLLLGTVLGVQLLKTLEQLGPVVVGGQEVPVIRPVILLAFILLLPAVGLRLWFSRETDADARPSGRLRGPRRPFPIAFPASGLPAFSWLSLSFWGGIIGGFAGLLGIGGGIFVVPVLNLGFGMPLRIAIGTSSLLILFSSLFSTAQHAYLGHVDFRLVLALLAGSSLGVTPGARHSHRLPVRTLRRAFALLLFLVVLLLAADLVKAFRYSPP
jgi:hypothetical protein